MADYLGVKNDIQVEKPEYSYIAHVLLDAFNTIARGRSYTANGVPLTISSTDINDYLQLNELPVEIDVFLAVIFMLDNEYIDEVREQIKKSAK